MFLLSVFLVLILVIFIKETQFGRDKKDFLLGKVPQPLPNGFYKGSVIGIKTPWLGKSFNSKDQTGVNVLINFLGGEKYPFKTYTGKGLIDNQLLVLKIDYSQFQNPWFVKAILDELVEIKPSQYVGKAILTLIPGFPITLGYFRLSQQ